MDATPGAMRAPPATPARRASVRWIALAIFALALLPRLAFVALRPHPLGSDEIDYDRLGARLAATATYSDETGPTAYRPVGYPAFVAAVYALTGPNPAHVRVVQAVCDAAVAVALFLILSRRRLAAGALAGSLWALFPPAVLFANCVLSESIYTAALVGFTLLVSARPRLTVPIAVLCGLLLGGLILTKPTTLILLLAMPWIAGARSSGRATGALLLCAIVPVVAWTARNAVVMGAPTLSTNGGVNLLIGNNPNATGSYSGAVSSILRTPHASEVDADRAARRAAVRYILERPGRFLVMGVAKMMVLATTEGELALGLFRSPNGIPKGGFREKARATPLLAHLIVSLPYVLIALAAMIGIATRTRDEVGGIFLAAATGALLSSFLFFGSSRFHFPLMPFATLFASELTFDWRPRMRGLTPARVIVATLLCMALVLTWIAEWTVIYQPRPA